jgi:hypothetical protein
MEDESIFNFAHIEFKSLDKMAEIVFHLGEDIIKDPRSHEVDHSLLAQKLLMIAEK